MTSVVGWQPIETAPKDGTQILTEHGVSKWESDKYAKKPRPYWTTARFMCPRALYDRAQQPTHWMPLPTPPSSGEG